MTAPTGKTAMTNPIDAIFDLYRNQTEKEPESEISALANQANILWERTRLLPKAIILETSICRCTRCQRAWTEEVGVYLLSAQLVGTTQELRLLTEIDSSLSGLPVRQQMVEPRTFPMCIRCYIQDKYA